MRQACSSFKIGDKVIFSDENGVEERGEIMSVPDDESGGYEYMFRADGWVAEVDACDLVLDEAASVRALSATFSTSYSAHGRLFVQKRISPSL